ncbi:MAG: PQQ-dependent sugar dehydrogenase [Anaerolineales bacterium]
MHKSTLLSAVFLLGISLVVWKIHPSAQPSQAVATASISVSEVIASGLEAPVDITHAGDGSGRLFIVEQPGRIRVIKQGALLSTPFLDITSLVLYGGERGFLGLAFHPDYEQNGYFYVNYTRQPDGATVVARYRVSTLNPDQADPNSATTLLIIDQPYANHNGGCLKFGPDGYLYIGMGDGGSGGDPQNYAQNKDSLLGKMLRIDVDHGSPYAIPADNPFVGQPGADEIWALGLRNPWRFSFDRLSGDLYIADVGQNLWEEVNFQASSTPGGVNYGWRCREGAHPYNSSPPCNDAAFLATLTDPFTEYSHSEGYSVTGGFVYRGSRYPNLYGTYFFADYVNGKIWSIKKLSDSPLTWSARTLELQAGFNISSFGEGEDGELYLANHNQGKIHHLTDPSGPVDLNEALKGSRKIVSSPWADENEVITYTIEIKNNTPSILANALLTDTLPTNLTYIAGSLTASNGTVDDSQAPLLRWNGSLSPGLTTLRYRAQIKPNAQGSQNNTAFLSINGLFTLSLGASVYVPRPKLNTASADFVLPGTQPNQLQTSLLDSTDCDTCHSAPIYDRWRGSVMSQSGRDPLMWAALAASNNVVPQSGELCLRCHLPNGWFDGHSQDPGGGLMTAQDLRNGISCQLCHRLVDPFPPAGTSDQASAIDAQIRQHLTDPLPANAIGNAMLIVDPNDNRRGPFELGQSFSYHSAYRTDFLGQTSDAITRSRLCGSCHNVFNPLLSWDAGRNQYWPNSGTPQATGDSPPYYPIETTFSEWLNSEYASEAGVYAPQFAGEKADGIVRACQDCHLTRATGFAADLGFNPFQRDCRTTGCLPTHDLLGANTWLPQLLLQESWRLNALSDQSYLEQNRLATQSFLSKAATLSVELLEQGSNKIARVTVTNESGHKLPTGYPEGRRMWLNLRAYGSNGNLLQEFGAYNPTTGEVANDTKIYEVLQGITLELADLLGIPAGHSFHFLLNNTVLKDNRIPPRGFTNAKFAQDGLRPVGATYADGQYWDTTDFTVPPETARVVVTLYYQTASTAYVAFLRQNGGLDGESLWNLAQSTPNSPQIVQIARYPELRYYFPLIFR